MVNRIVIAFASALLNAAPSLGVTIPTVLVDNPGNGPDAVVMGDGTTGYGDVAYPYRIGTHEVTNSDYAAFLNAVADADPNGLYSTDMTISFNGGITRSGAAGSYVYGTKAGFANKPVIFVSFYDAARFCNWLHNGQPTGPQGPGTTETGAYSMLGVNAVGPGNLDGNGRNNDWLWALPTEDEWHKAAYNGPGNTWTMFATQNNATPVSQPPPGGVNSANYNSAVPALTVAGAYTQTLSYWGAYQMNGNLAEWNEGSFFAGSLLRRICGGDWNAGSNGMRADYRGGVDSGSFANERTGFRVVQAVITTGACCLPVGGCVEGSSGSECAASGGVYHGHGSLCASAGCAAEVGACCFADGSCAGPITAGDCAAQGGLYRGTGSTCATAGCAPVGPVVYVNSAAAAGGNGTGWKQAFQDLQDALEQAAAFPDAVDEIWIAAGQYTPDRNTGDRGFSFRVSGGLRLYGGFSGGETELRQRDPVANPTMLSGDLAGNDVFNIGQVNTSVDENSYHVVITDGTTSAAVLDGLTIRSGNASWLGVQDHGGGVLNIGGDLSLVNCTLAYNRTGAGIGGGMYNQDANPTLVNCVIDSNDNAMTNQDSAPMLQGCTVIRNVNTAVRNLASSMTAVDCDFTANEGGPALRNEAGSDGVFTECDFTNNIGFGFGGAAAFNLDCAPTFDGCGFLNNHTNNGSAGAAFASGGASFIDCSFIGNAAFYKGGAVLASGSEFGSPSFANCVFQDNHASGDGGGIALGGAFQITCTECQFIGNSATGFGGGAYHQGFANVLYLTCSFSGNTSLQGGGGIYHFNDGLFTLDQCTLSGNSAPLGKGIFNRRGLLAGNASLTGDDGIVNGMNFSPSRQTPPSDIGAFTVAGGYRHALLGETGDQVPVLLIDIAGLKPGVEHDVINVAGAVQIDGGSLVLNFAGGFAPAPGDAFDVITGASISGEFDLIGASGLPAGLTVELSYLPTSVRATVVEGEAPVYSSAPIVPFTGVPTDAATLDYDADGFADLAITVPAGFANDPGTALVFRNAGVDRDGNWLGFQTTPLITTVQGQPASIAAADLNADGLPDLLVANQSESTVSVLRNLSGTGFLLVQNYAAGGEAPSVAAGQLAGDGLIDFAVVNKTQSKVRIYRNLGNFSFSTAQDLSAGPNTSAVALADLQSGTGLDILAANASNYLYPPSVLSVHLNEGAFQPAVDYAVGRAPTNLISTLLDSDSQPDAITANQVEQSLSVLLGNASDPGTFLPAIDVAVGGAPVSLAAVDLEPDGDNDVVVVVKQPTGPRADLKLITNSQDGDGHMQLTVNDLPTRNNPALVLASDVDGDGDQDLIIINSDAASGVASGGASSSIEVLLNGVAPTPGDVTGDGSVDIDDLLAVIAAWGPCPPPCPADIAPAGPPQGNGAVDIDDLLMVINHWG